MENYLMGENVSQWKGGIAQTITFVITQDCNLRCKYCYMVDKNSEHVMSFEVGEQAIDYFLSNSDLFMGEAVILEFIGGEPLLEIDLMDHLTDYFKVKAYELNHKWFNMYRISISTNGLLYSSKKVQKYILKNRFKLSIGISLDGTKEKNDLQRVYPDGSGSYDDIVKNIPLWLKQLPGAHTKVTIGHDDLPYVKESIIHLWGLGMDTIPANVVFEDVWEEGDDEIFFEQLKQLADYIIDNDLWKKNNTTLFTQGIGYPLNSEELNRNSCGSGAMIAVDAKGNLYPCIRFMGYSLDNKKEYITGNIYDGIDRNKVRPFYLLDTKSESDEECLNCEVASGCSWCSGYNYDQSENGTLFYRSKSICKMHKARVRANNYLWSRLSREKNVPLKRSKNMLHHLFIMLSDDSVAFCNYSVTDSGRKINDEFLKCAATFCSENFYTPVLIHSSDKTLSSRAESIFSGLLYINIYPADNIGNCNANDIIYYDVKSIQQSSNVSNCCILKIEQEEINQLSDRCCLALEKYSRVNVILIHNPKTLDTEKYYRQLCSISNKLYDYYASKKIKQVNVLTDDLISTKRVNCDFGVNNFVMAPDGMVYTCPAAYYDNTEVSVGGIDSINGFINSRLYDIRNNKICKRCEIKHCSFCNFWSKKITGEYGVPSAEQCKIAQIERKASFYLYDKLSRGNFVEWFVNEINEITFEDPLIVQPSNLKSMMNFSYEI